MSGVIDRWLTAQAEEPAAEEAPPTQYEYKPTKPYGVGGTPKKIEYLDETAREVGEQIATARSEIDRVAKETKAIMDEAKKKAKELEKQEGVPGLTETIGKLAQTLGEHLDQIDQEAEVVYRQGNGLVYALQRKKKKIVKEPGADEQVEFILNELSNVSSDLSKSVKLKLAAFKRRMTSVEEQIDHLVSVFTKPKSVESMTRNAGIRDVFDAAVSYMHSAVSSLGDFLSDLVGYKDRLTSLEKAVESL